MSAVEGFEDEFDDVVRQRGSLYFSSGLVSISRMTPARLTAKVRGSYIYKVTLTYSEEDDFLWECTCPYDWGNCKHIWATMLAAEASGWQPLAGLTDEDRSAPATSRSAPAKQRSAVATPKQSKEPVARWKTELNRIKTQMSQRSGPLMLSTPAPQPWPTEREICYVVDVDTRMNYEVGPFVEVMIREPKKNGKPAKWKREHPGGASWSNAPEEDRLIGQMLTGCAGEYGGYAYSSARYRVDESKYDTILRRICQTGRCRLRDAVQQQPGNVIAWDDGEPWTFQLEVRPASGARYELVGYFQRPATGGGERMELSDAHPILPNGLLLAGDKLSRVDHRGAFELQTMLREKKALPLAKNALPELLQSLCEMPRLPKMNWPADFPVSESEAAPRPILKIRAPASRHAFETNLSAQLTFDYDGRVVEGHEPNDAILDAANRRIIRRGHEIEAQYKQRLQQLGFRVEWTYSSGRQHNQWRLAPDRLAPAVVVLTREGWHVEADGKLFRSGGEIRVEVSSGIDWFDLNGRAQFGDTGIALPKLLAAVEKGQNTVVLDDGTFGIVPEKWLKQYAPFVQMGETLGDSIRFTPAQAGFLDALLVAMPEARCDRTFDRVRQQLASFAGIAPAECAPGFGGDLRDYQKEGLGWLEFLQKFNFGGCLADDMGLGKTVQVLALLHRRREAGKGASLVVVPRSLVFNWKQEAARFTPDLRVLDQTGATRARDAANFADHDLVLTTYGTLRRDITSFKDFEFDYVILDESQAIKNAATQSAKAVRLLRGNHRLALSGTPIENHLGELWSLFEFLNPKMLGSVTVFRNLIQSNGQVDTAGKSMLASALRPFILRRTKSQVARELPEKIEQTIVCPLEGEQRKMYDELKEHYRASLLGLIEKNGIARSKIQILEALLRLRQAACHPGLIDKSQADTGSSKLQALLANLSEIVAEGHKVLVFSQFTTLLAIVRKALDKEQIVYEYLDGKTRDRQAKVERFQSDAKCPVFLISLKAGGVGLNLTAAEYVFLLDPWWNPAVEAQAVDRAHRIGQARTVFAYRLIAKDTVEDKILELQKSKRDLADAIITEDNSVIAKMGTEELRMLLA